MNYEMLSTVVLGLATLATVAKVTETRETEKTKRQRLRSEASIVCAGQGITVEQCPSNLTTFEFG